LVYNYLNSLLQHSLAGLRLSVVPSSLIWQGPYARIVHDMPTATIFTGTT